MKEICKECERVEYCMYPCSKFLNEQDVCPVCGNKLIHAGGCTQCITGDWSKCG